MIPINEITEEHISGFVSLLKYDAERGTLHSVHGIPKARVPIMGEVGYINNGYRTARIKGKAWAVHRVIWAMHNGPLPGILEIDHIDGNPLNNRLENLRAVTRQMNTQNLHRARKDSITGLAGTYPNGNGFSARIRVHGREKHLGTFPTAEDAHTVYVDAKRKLHAGCVI